jgi:hypothetical protein
MASTFINGDLTGITDEKESRINNLLSYINDHNLGYCVDVSEESSSHHSSLPSIRFNFVLWGNFRRGLLDLYIFTQWIIKKSIYSIKH